MSPREPSNSHQTCARCGAALPADARPDQPCARCLLRVGMEPSGSGLGGQRVSAPSLAELQPHFPRLELLALVGEGGMGAVYKARDRELERVVALKILTVRDEEGAQFDERFAREARALARLSHPNIAAVYDHGKAGPWSYLVLEYVDGENLRRVLRTRAVQPAEALRWVGEICGALQYAHEQGVVHRDIKPENVLVDAKGRVKVVDFGLAKLLDRRPGEATLTASQQSLGTWHYMAPEQYERPQTVDHRADIYSLGVVFYELLTGQVPVGRFDLPSQRIQVDVRVDEVVLKALAREPEKRWQAASEVKSQVDTIGSGAAGSGPPVARTPAGSAPQAARNGTPTGVVVAIVVGAIVVAGLVWLGAMLLFGLYLMPGEPVAAPEITAQLEPSASAVVSEAAPRGALGVVERLRWIGWPTLVPIACMLLFALTWFWPSATPDRPRSVGRRVAAVLVPTVGLALGALVWITTGSLLNRAAAGEPLSPGLPERLTLRWLSLLLLAAMFAGVVALVVYLVVRFSRRAPASGRR